jgi:hypothetical protein
MLLVPDVRQSNAATKKIAVLSVPPHPAAQPQALWSFRIGWNWNIYMIFWGCDPTFVTCVKFHVETKSHLEHGYSENMFQMGVFCSM